jgi:RNA recognition motif-containing protein
VLCHNFGRVQGITDHQIWCRLVNQGGPDGGAEGARHPQVGRRFNFDEYKSLQIRNLQPDVTEGAVAAMLTRDDYDDFTVKFIRDENGMSTGFGFIDFGSHNAAEMARDEYHISQVRVPTLPYIDLHAVGNLLHLQPEASAQCLCHQPCRKAPGHGQLKPNMVMNISKDPWASADSGLSNLIRIEGLYFNRCNLARVHPM